MATVITATLLAILSASVLAVPEQGKWIFTLNKKNQFAAVTKHMYRDSKIFVSVSFVSLECSDPDSVEISWWLRMSPCAMEFNTATDSINQVDSTDTPTGKVVNYIVPPEVEITLPYDQIEWKADTFGHLCSEHEFQIEGDPDAPLHILKKLSRNATTPAPAPAPDSKAQQPSASGDQSASSGNQSKPEEKKEGTPSNPTAAPSRRKRDATPAAAVTTAPPKQPKPNKLDHQPAATTWVDGNYLFVVHIDPADKNFVAVVTIRTVYGDDNYISAMDYPLLIFYGLMGLIYIGYGLVWLVLLACNWRDLLRVQFWVGGVILLGMLEKAVFFAEYENINKTGQSVRGAVIFAELVSCMKRTLARMLVIIVSLGFGIVKPRLGQTFHKVMCVGGLYFILASIEGCMRAVTPTAIQSNQFLLAAVPLAVLEAIICWWIFSSLIQTTRTLRLRRNVVKLTLYRHFTNTLIFAVLASIACMVWSMTQHRFKECIEDWKQLWIDEAFWHMLFVLLLFIIMLLWRPTANNQRYAFSPLLDAADEEDDEDALMNDAFDGMKMRGVKPANGSRESRDVMSKVEDDLKWVEENIPSSMADKALPTLLDSDEELMTTKFEMSKME